jgi:hypothetical protein
MIFILANTADVLPRRPEEHEGFSAKNFVLLALGSEKITCHKRYRVISKRTNINDFYFGPY